MNLRLPDAERAKKRAYFLVSPYVSHLASPSLEDMRGTVKLAHEKELRFRG